MMRGKRKRVSPRGNRLESGMNAMAMRRLFILDISRWPPVEREPIGSFGKKWRTGRLVQQGKNCSQDNFGIFLEYSRPRKEGREFS